ncbi:MAG: flagellar biosynthesis protein FliQ [Peptococcaceae bacterium]|nr:flagellar biosynthesis protein FliQ [Peptococcaceae bacterium]
MTPNYVIYLAKQALSVVVLVGGPVLGVVLVVGFVVSVMQALTQIQEQTLSFIPKLIAIALVLLLLGPWMLQVLMGFTTNLFNSLASFSNF